MSLQSSRSFKTRTLLWLVPTASALVVVDCLAFRWWRRARRETAKRRQPVTWNMTWFHNLDLEADEVLGCLKEENAIGREGAGTVYRCVTRGGAEVTVKRLPGAGRRDNGFRAKVTTLDGIRHRNVVQLLGFASSAEKTDVYSFGVVLLELVTRRRPLGDFGDEIDLIPWARSVVPRPTAAILAVADPRLPPEPAGLIARLFMMGISCIRESSQARPTMREVVHVLSGFVAPPPDLACSTSALPL